MSKVCFIPCLADSLSWSAVFVFWLLRMEEKMPWRLITPGLARGENPKKVAQVHLEVSVIANQYVLKTQCKVHPQVEDKHAISVFRFCVCVSTT